MKYLEIVVMVVQLHGCTKTHSVLYFKREDFMVYELHLGKVIFKKKSRARDGAG
jgi:hypothetical protein